MANTLWIKKCTRWKCLTTNRPKKCSLLTKSAALSEQGTWHTPLGLIRQQGCTRQRSWKSERKKKKRMTLSQTRILTSSVSIWHPPACSPPPSPTAAAAGSVLRCLGTVLAGILLLSAGYNGQEEAEEEAEEEVTRHWSRTNMNSGSMSPGWEETCCWGAICLRAVAPPGRKGATSHRESHSNLRSMICSSDRKITTN